MIFISQGMCSQGLNRPLLASYRCPLLGVSSPWTSHMVGFFSKGLRIKGSTLLSVEAKSYFRGAPNTGWPHQEYFCLATLLCLKPLSSSVERH